MELEFGGQRYPVPPGELVIGGDAAAGLVLAGAASRHAAVRLLGGRMATIRALAEGAGILVNGVAVGHEPTPLLDGDLIRIGDHQIRVLDPAHRVGGPTSPPEGARERLHDTLFGVPRPRLDQPPAAPVPIRRSSGHLWIILAAAAALAAVAYLLVS
jgi:hypothetical protein